MNPVPTSATNRLPLTLHTQRSDEWRAGEQAWLVGGVAAAHLLGLWGLMQLGAVHDAVRQLAPLVVDFITVQPPRPHEPAPPPPRQPPRPLPRPVAPPPILSSSLTPEPAPAVFVVPPPPAIPEPVVPPAPPAPPAQPAPPTPPPPAPPPPRTLPASNIAYLVPPPIEVPLVSRRLREEGTVHLRVLVGVDGLPRQVAVQRSSGFERLDEQALSAMKRARFKPQTDQGVPIEWIVIAPLQYEIH